MKVKRFSTIGLLLASILLTSACGDGEPSQVKPEETAEPIANMANPAAVYCGELGYAMENVTRNGGEDADCIFPDESRCGQWDFLSGRCGQEFSYCSLQGYNLGEGTNIGTCHVNFQMVQPVMNSYSFPVIVHREIIQRLLLKKNWFKSWDFPRRVIF